MKNNHRSGSLFALLTRNYLAFTAALLLIAVLVYSLWLWQSDVLFDLPDVQKFLNTKELLNGNYSKLKPDELLGPDSAFAVFDSSGSIVYRSSNRLLNDLTPEELSCIPQWDSSDYISFSKFTDSNGKLMYIVTKTTFDDERGEETLSMLLDDDLNVISGGFEPQKSKYTQRELQLLTNSADPDAQLFKCSFTAADGNTMQLVLRLSYYTAEYYDRISAQAAEVWFLFLPLYMICAAGFILWLNRRIRRPLEKLDSAIVGMRPGKPTKAAECGGPKEITRLGQSFDALAESLAKSEQERQRLDAGRQKLIADISHDLKTPITVICGYANAISDGKVPYSELPRYLEAIDSKARSLSQLINTFYEYSKVEHPQFSIHPKTADICEFVREYLAQKYEEIDLAGFTLEVSIPEERIFCKIDSFMLSRALDNILSNSLKHNTLGTLLFVKLYVAGGSVHLHIADNGTGIPNSMRERIFDPFVTGDESRSNGGSGLGLAITRKIITAHRGTISLVSPPSSGLSTEFEIILPL